MTNPSLRETYRPTSSSTWPCYSTHLCTLPWLAVPVPSTPLWIPVRNMLCSSVSSTESPPFITAEWINLVILGGRLWECAICPAREHV